MKDYHRIDKSRFSGRYIGYACNQVWHILRSSPQTQWTAYCRDEPWRGALFADTLRQMNQELERAHLAYEQEKKS